MQMKMKSTTLGLLAAALMTAPAFAAGYIPLGPKVYTPQPPIITPNPDIVTPQPPIVTPQPPTVTPQPPTITPQPPTITETEVIVKPATNESSSGPSGTPAWSDAEAYYKGGHWNEKCQTSAYVNDDCTVLSLNPGGGGFPAVTAIEVTVTENPDLVTPNPDIVTPNPDIVTPQPDLVTPQPPTITPQPDVCTQPGWSPSGGFGNYNC